MRPDYMVYFLLIATLCLLGVGYTVLKLYLTNDDYIQQLEFDIRTLNQKSITANLTIENRIIFKDKIREARSLLTKFIETKQRKFGYQCDYIIDECYELFCEDRCCRSCVFEMCCEQNENNKS